MSEIKHPKGLYYLFFTEMWERFGYYLMLGIFSLYMLDSVENGGMGFGGEKKSDVYGTYIGLVYLTPFIGGLLADRVLGYRKSILIGGLLMAFGYFGLSLPGEGAFYVSLLAIIVGNGFFKPNISTLLGNLYNNEKYIANKDAGYNIFYAGINIGAFFCNFVAAYLRINYGWGWAFAAAGVGMLIGIVIFLAGTRHVKEADVIKPVQPGDLSLGKIFSVVLLPMLVFGVIGFFINGTGQADSNHLLGSDSNDAFIFGCIPVIFFFIYLFVKANQEDKRPIGALLSVFACIIVFWAVFHQNGDALTVWAEEYTDREMPAAISKPAEAVDMAQKITYYPSVDLSEEEFTERMNKLKAEKETAFLAGNKAASDSLQRIIGPEETAYKYFHNLPPSERPEPGTDLKLYSAELYQSINPFWVVLLTPVLVAFWGFMRSKKKEPTTPTKIALGLVITALSALVMVAAVKTTDIHNEKASSFWLIASYGVITIGELCLSPMGLSLVSKLSPSRLTALMMGGFFLSTSLGNKLAGMLGSMWEKYEDKSTFFLVNFALVMAAALMLFAMLKWLNSVMREKGIR